MTPMKMEIIIQMTQTYNVLGVKVRRIKELMFVVQKIFNFLGTFVITLIHNVSNSV